ncbi:MAG TPA: crossover junction endodeoxyribonuclease RuvC [Ignavibacteria bacterium]|nr:crossover junction endodeoxyribonuclease RuvC [Ignavibacteria bacterium]
MRIIGIDPGTIITGIGIIECKNGKITVINFDTINSKSTEHLSDRLKKIYDICCKKIDEFEPDEFAIETAFYSKNVQSTLKLGQARGVAIISAANAKLKITEYSPREVKKSVTGNGASSKEVVRQIVKRILNIRENPQFIDTTDALAVALCHYYSFGNIFKEFKTKRNGVSNKNGWKKFVEENPDKILNR